MRLADMAWRPRRIKIGVALEIALGQLTAPASTIEVARSVARLLGSSEVPLIARDLQKIAPALPSSARQGAPKQDSYGQRRPWIWSPRQRVLEPVAADIPEWDR